MKENYDNKYGGEKKVIDEVSVYFNDILRNKEMIKEMFKTNILVYEDKIKSTNQKLGELKEELEKLISEFVIIENKLKLNYAKSHDQFQKHEINYKLLDKTYIHYKMLINERQDEIKKLEEQSIFAHQDYQNKKIKFDCINVQIIEAEYQLKNIQKRVDEQLNSMLENSDDFNCTKSCITELNDKRNTENNHVENIEQFLTDNMPYKSNYRKDSSVISDKNELKNNLYISMSLNDDRLSKRKCYIY